MRFTSFNFYSLFLGGGGVKIYSTDLKVLAWLLIGIYIITFMELYIREDNRNMTALMLFGYQINIEFDDI